MLRCNKSTLWWCLLLLLICLLLQQTFGNPILGQQTDIEDTRNSKIQGHLKPIFKFCDQIGYHFNCMMSCKSLGHGTGHCGSDFICSCF